MKIQLTRSVLYINEMTKDSNSLGELIYLTKDDDGIITIFEKQNLRYLTFGNHVEQSCLTLDRPYRLEHVYTQAMMLGLLLKSDIRSVLLLGLGGGSLVRALHHVKPKLKIHAVEYRPAIIEIARSYFEMPDSQHLRFHCDNAQHFLEADNSRYDLIFADLYLPEGVHASQLSADFFGLCRQHLNENGILLVNQWCSDFQITRVGKEAVLKAFDSQVLSMHVQGGNNIIFAFNDDLPDLNRKAFFEAAQQLGLKLDIPLQKHARSLWQQNAEALQIGRYKNLMR